MSLFTKLKGGRGLSTWSRPKKWASRRWTPFLLDCGRVTVYGVSRLWFGSTLTRWEVEGVSIPLINISYYGDLYMLARRKVADGQGEGVQSAAPLDWKTIAKLHNIILHLATTKWDDGTPRKPGRMTVETRGALWQVQLSDLDACAVLRVNGPTLPEALQAANLLLESPDTLWEPAPWLQESKVKGKRK